MTALHHVTGAADGRVGSAQERIFDLAELPELPTTQHPGLLVLVDPARWQTRQPGVVHVATWPRQRWWVLHVTDGDALGRAQLLRHTLGVLGVTPHDGGPFTRAATLALLLADHLGRLRHPDRGADADRVHLRTAAAVTSANPELLTTTPTMLRLPHFVTVRARATPQDAVVWEWISRSDVANWLRGPVPDLGWVHAHLPDLLVLRATARTGHLLDTPEHRELADALRHRYFSGRFVLEHHELIRRLIGAIDKENPS